MIALLLSILASGSLVLLFRSFERYSLPLLPIIVVNYITCVLCGLFLRPNEVIPAFAGVSLSGAYYLAFVQGILFISIFYVMGITTQRISGAYTSLMGKISVVIPTIVSFFLFHDPFPWMRVLGFFLALVSLILIHLPYLRDVEGRRKQELILLGSTLFLGSGIIDTNFKMYQEWFAHVLPQFGLIVLIFGIAGILGFFSLAVQGRARLLFQFPVLIAGVLLGSVNFFSLVFLLEGLSQLPATLFFPANNIGIILCTALGERILFKIRFTSEAMWGLLLASLSIGLIIWD